MTSWPFRRRTWAPPAGSPAEGVAGVVPCAGESTRMGTSKALLDAGGRSFLGAAVGALAGGGCDPLLVVVRADQTDEARKAREAGALPVVNPDPADGPIASLRVALVSLAELGRTVEGVAFLPVDHPRVRPETVASLREALLAGDAPVVVPVHRGRRGHPALFSRSVFHELLDPALEGGARTVVHAHLDRAVLVEVDDEGVVLDVDTPEAYRRAFPGAWGP